LDPSASLTVYYIFGTKWRDAVISYSTFQHVLVGDLILVAEEDRLIRSSYTDSKLAPSVGADWVRAPKHPVLAEAVAQLKEYLAAERSTLTIPLQIQGTEFQRKVYNLVRQIPVGAVTSYTNIAAKLDMPRAGRSVGAAIGKNPLLIFIPDHRVINQRGSVGGFAGKWNRKPGLLDLEKRLAAKNKSV
jgi:methylated-DNA-[protein]-cysteine S-methyltransferase